MTRLLAQATRERPGVSSVVAARSGLWTGAAALRRRGKIVRRYVAALFALGVLILVTIVLLGPGRSERGARTVVLVGMQAVSASAISPVVVDDATGHAFAALPAGGHVGVVDVSAGLQQHVIDLADSAASPGSVSSLVVSARTGHVFGIVRHTADAPQMSDTLDVLDGATGHLIAQTAIPASVMPEQPIVDDATGRVFVVEKPLSVTGDTISVSAVDATIGRVLHTAFVVPPSSAAGCSASLYATSIGQLSGRLYVINLTTGVTGVLDGRSGQVVRIIAPRLPGPLQCAAQTIAPPVVDERARRIWMQTIGAGLSCACTFSTYDLATGQLVRRIGIDQGIALAYSARAGRVFSVSNRGTVSVIDARSGRLVRTIVLGRAFAVYELVADSTHRTMVVADDRDGVIDILDEVSGRVLRRIVLDLPLVDRGFAVDTRRGRVVAVTSEGASTGDSVGAGRVNLIDERSGMIQSWPTDRNPRLVAVAERDGRISILSNGASNPTPAVDPWRWLPQPVRSLLPFIPLPQPDEGGTRLSVIDP